MIGVVFLRRRAGYYCRMVDRARSNAEAEGFRDLAGAFQLEAQLLERAQPQEPHWWAGRGRLWPEEAPALREP